jgi:hypothetical protein
MPGLWRHRPHRLENYRATAARRRDALVAASDIDAVPPEVSMVQTALEAPGVETNDEAWSLWAAIVEQHGLQQ